MDIEKAIEWEKAFKRTYNGMPQEVDEACDYTIAALEELQQYRQIGMVDECRAAREKQIPKEPIDDKYRHKCCPICGWLVCYDEGWGDKYVPHCENCGQALKWGD